MKLQWSGRKTATKKAGQMGNEEVIQRVQNRAFDLYEQRGYAHGNDLADWFKAEKEIAKELKVKKFSRN